MENVSIYNTEIDISYDRFFDLFVYQINNEDEDVMESIKES